MKNRSLRSKILLLLGALLNLLLIGCSSTERISYLETSAEPPKPALETITVNNCGGISTKEAVAKRSISASVPDAYKLGYSANTLQSAAAKSYSEKGDTSLTVNLVAPPGTFKEFTVMWTEQKKSGFVSAQGKLGTALAYNVMVPLKGEVVSSADLACSLTPIPTPTIGAIRVLDISTEELAGGVMKENAKLSAGPFSIGTMDLVYPTSISLTDSKRVGLTIIPDVKLSSSAPVPVRTPFPNAPPFLFHYNDTIEIFPLMAAELQGKVFDIDPEGKRDKVIISSTTVEWVWVLHPRQEGKHDLNLEISIPVMINESTRSLSTRSLRNVPFTIEVLTNRAATGTSLQTEIPWYTRILDSVIANFYVICATIITAMATLGAVYLAWWLNQRNEKRKTKRHRNS